MRKNVLWTLLLGSLLLGSARAEVDWQAHAPAAFDQAAKHNKLLILDLVAVWCHWCHVMEATTYADPAVQQALAKDYVAIKADHDARPDLAERYRDYGWPATVVMTPDGRELIKRAGYISPEDMLSLLAEGQRLAALPPPAERQREQLAEFERDLGPTVRQQLLARHLGSEDRQLGGLALMQKFLDPDTVEYDLRLAAAGNASAEQRVRRHLDAAMQLIDPVFGGAYQYSTHGDWQHPHYEKIVATQAAYLRVYSLASNQLGEPRYLQAAEQVAAYLAEFWRSPQGGFFNSQDADLKQGTKGHDYFALDRSSRLANGLPRIDTNRYASSNGLLIEGLLSLYQASNNKAHLRLAVEAFSWAMKSRRLQTGGFVHGEGDLQARYLADTLYMGRAQLAMYRVSGQARWLQGAEQSAAFLAQFKLPAGGLAAARDDGTPLKPQPQLDQNIHAARFLIALANEGDASAQQLALHVMRYLGQESVALSRLTDAGILLAADELQQLLVPQARQAEETEVHYAGL